VAKSLCEAGCSVNVRNREGETPLLTASARGFHDIVECLAGHGADLNASDKVLCRAVHPAHRDAIWRGGWLGGPQGSLRKPTVECNKVQLPSAPKTSFHILFNN
jgi:ankyrin repeat protein